MRRPDLDKLRSAARGEMGGTVVPFRRPEQVTLSEMRPAIDRAFQGILDRVQRGGGLAGAESGFYRLDKVLDGWQRGRFYVLGGRTGMGKSVVGLNVAMGLANNGNGVDFLSLEMPTEEQALRCILAASGVPHYRIKNNSVGQDHWRAMTDCVKRISSWPWLWDDRGGVTVEWIAEHVKASKAAMASKGSELHTVVIDHVQKIRGSNERAPRREQMIWIVDGLKQLAKRENVCILALAQIGRGTEARNQKDRKPRMADLQEAGAIEQEADAVMLLFREDYYRKREEWDHVLEVAVPKNRGGAPGGVNLSFDGSCYRIENGDETDQDWGED